MQRVLALLGAPGSRREIESSAPTQLVPASKTDSQEQEVAISEPKCQYLHRDCQV